VVVVVVVVVDVVAILNFGLVLSAAETAWTNSIPKMCKNSDFVKRKRESMKKYRI